MLKTIVLKNFASRKKHKLGGTISLNRGYGRYLIKQGYVLPETYKNKEIANKLLLEEQRKKESKITNAHMIKTNLEKENISFIITNCNGNGILFGAISVKDIVRKLNTINEKLYGSIKAHEVRLKKAIKTHGIYICEIFLYDDIHAYVNIND
jgi:ribosomal protein L9